jgi:hypothetical protein
MRAVKDSLAAPDRGEVEGGPKGCRSTAAVGITSLPCTRWERERRRRSERSMRAVGIIPAIPSEKVGANLNVRQTV